MEREFPPNFYSARFVIGTGAFAEKTKQSKTKNQKTSQCLRNEECRVHMGAIKNGIVQGSVAKGSSRQYMTMYDNAVGFCIHFPLLPESILPAGGVLEGGRGTTGI